MDRKARHNRAHDVDLRVDLHDGISIEAMCKEWSGRRRHWFTVRIRRVGEKTPERRCVTTGPSAKGALSTKFRRHSRLQGGSVVHTASPTFQTGIWGSL